LNWSLKNIKEEAAAGSSPVVAQLELLPQLQFLQP
jgi:hypothetical protein